jgi:hypothetical protein
MPPIIDPDGVEIVTMRELVDFEALRIVEIGCRLSSQPSCG